MIARLVVKEGYELGATFDLPAEGGEIGRGAGCVVRLSDKKASRQHARLESRAGAWHLVDLGSANGTLLNSRRVGEPARLKPGDEIKVGLTTLVFELGEGAVVGRPTTAPPAPAARPPEAVPTGVPVGEAAVPAAPALRLVEEPPPAGGADIPVGHGQAGMPAPPPPVPAAPAAPPAVPEAGLKGGELLKLLEETKQKIARLRQEIHRVIVGQEEVVAQLLMAMFSRGHCHLVGVPGLAKTLMVRTIAEAFDLRFKRIQFTPDLMPSDITGTDVLEEDESGRKGFRFVKGPLFTNILLADEINRTPPKTQAALLEAMQEYRVTASGQTYELPLPFFVLATQNPIEQEGTYPLPEAQLDRFMFSVVVDYPDERDEERIVSATTVRDLPIPTRVMAAAEVLRLQEVVRALPVSPHVVRYATRLARRTRPGTPETPEFVNRWVAIGAGPRASQYLVLGAKARAVLEGRPNVSCADVRAAAVPVLRHRIFTNFTADSEGVRPATLVQKLLEAVPEPTPEEYRRAKT